MTTRRKVAIALGSTFALLLFLLAAVPLLFRGPIENRLKAQLGRGIAAHVDWQDLRLGLFREFPNLTLALDRLTVSGIDRFAGDTLLTVPHVRLVLDLGSVWRSVRGSAPVVVRSVALEQPRVRLLVLADGTANWDIARPDTSAPGRTGRPLSLSLRSFELSEGEITLDNRQANLQASVIGLRESLRGDFRKTRFTASTRTLADTVSLRFGGVPWLQRVRLDLAADLEVDTEAKRVAVERTELRLNELVLALTGSVAAAGDSLAIDVAFNTPGTQFRDVLSLVPAVYSQGFATLQTAGTMTVGGTVRGGWGEHTFPALALAAKVENGSFRYPDLPLPARDVRLDLAVHNPGGSADLTVASLDRLHIVLGDDPFQGSFVLRTPISDPDVELALDGRLDLANVRRTFKLPGIEQLEGVIVADAAMRARKSDLDRQRYERVSARGGFTVSGLSLQGEDLPHPLRVARAELRLSPRRAELASLEGSLGSSDITASGSLDNLLGFALRHEELRGAARVTSRRFDLNEWRSDDPTRAIPVPRNIDFALDASVGQLLFGTLDMRNAHGALRVKDQRVTLEDFDVEMLGGAVAITGFYETLDPTRPMFDVALEARDLDVAAAFEGLRTVQAFAPIARYAQGHVSTDLKLKGALGEDLMPVREVLSGLGSLRTREVVLRDFPALDRLADMLHVDQLRDPGLRDLVSSIEIRDGRLHVQPFDVGLGPLTMNVAGSNGFDHSLAYTLGLQLPRALLGTEANRVVTNLVTQAGRTGVDLQAAETVNLAVQLGGTVTDPSVTTSLRDLAGSTVAGVQEALREEAQSRVDTARQRLDAAAAEARARAQARMIAEAETRAAAVRAEARQLADAFKREGYARADSLVARASSPIARVAAQAAADRMRRETDARATQMVSEADARADALVAEARRRAAAGDTVASP